MKKRFIILLIFLLTLLLPFVISCNNTKLTAEQIYEQVSPSVVTITAESSSTINYGSGFFYKNGSTVVTNYHVIQDCSSASITLSNGQSYEVLSVLGHDKDKDIAILKVDFKNGKPLKIRTSDVNTGEKVYAIGNSLGFLGGSLSDGIISTAKREVDGQVFIQTTASVTHGNSGGPLIDEYGKVIGIVSSGFGDGLDLNLAIPIAEVDKVDISKPSKLYEIINVEWISNRQVWHQDESNRYVLVFTLADSNKNPVSVPGSVYITITNNYNETVYDKLHKFDIEDFRYWYYDDYTVKKYQATIYIKDSDINADYCSSGNLNFRVYGNGYFFSKYSLSIDDLPTKSVYNNTVTERTVYTAQDFIDNINHNRKIILGSNYYDFTNVDISKNMLLQSQTYDREGFIFNGIYNLSIEGKAEIVISDLSSIVLSFNNCSKLSLEGLTVGHINPPSVYSCEGAVIYLNDCVDIKITNCNLYGCGSVGIDADNSTNIIVTSTEIYDCSYEGISLQDSSASFNDCKIYDLSSVSSVIYSDNSIIQLSNCTIKDTNTTVNSWRECFILSPDYNGDSTITFDYCNISNNTFTNIALTTATNITFNYCTFNNNSSIRLHNGISFTKCTFDSPLLKSARDCVVDWLKNNYQTYENDVMNFGATSDDSADYYGLEYNVSTDHLYIGSLWKFENGDSMFLLLSMDGTASKYSYSATYLSGEQQNDTRGFIYADIFTSSTPLTYTSYSGDYWNQESLLNLYNSGFMDLIEFLDWCLKLNEIGVSIADFGFTQITFSN